MQTPCIEPFLPGFELQGKVESVLVTLDLAKGFETMPLARLNFFASEGLWVDRHHGPFRKVGDREAELRRFGYERGHKIANYRMFSAMAAEDLPLIAAAMGIPHIGHGWLGENLVLSGIPQLSRLPARTTLIFCDPGAAPGKENATGVLSVWQENIPCIGPGQVIQEKYPEVPRLASKFPKASMGRRGIVGMVYCSGYAEPGQAVRVLVPKQRIYDPLEILPKQHAEACSEAAAEKTE